MSDQYIGEIRSFGFNFAPYGWFQCNGQILSIQAYTELFAVIGTYFGGNGTTNFQLPNLQGSVPMHWGTSTSGTTYGLGETDGTTTVSLSTTQLPLHSHLVQAAESTALKTPTPGPATWLGLAAAALMYVPNATINTNLAAAAVGANTGGSLPHENMQPFLTINYCIAHIGAYPPRG
jgi:microcystin-dependent protein